MYKGTVAFYTLGCKVNSFATEAMAELFEKAGYEVVHFDGAADVYVVNTCTVTHLGDRKSRNMLRRARRHNPWATIVAAGCYAQVAPEEVAAVTEVDLIIGTQDRLRIVEMVEGFCREEGQYNAVYDNSRSRDFEELTVSENRSHTRAFLKVQEGCDQFCTYCIVPYARGRVRSRSLDSVVAEVSRLVEAGFWEMVLTGIHIASYGKDMDGDIGLLQLIQAVAAVPGMCRIRLGSLEPLILSEDFVQELSKIKAFCPHFHLSLQSGSDTVLGRMHRRYPTAEYAEIVERIRRHFDCPAITTDIMVGFPGETEAEFEETLAFVKAIQFYQVHVFKYSRRQGTPAADMVDQIPEDVKTRHSQHLIALSKALEDDFLKANHGRQLEVLFERLTEDGLMEGHTDNYLPVKMRGSQNNCGKIVQVEVSYKNKVLFMGANPV
ncbi:tRNA (N(6)-L-threonylcarbamoyladenosine(37)-C(2))-methylthiotransferase MtaB [Eubacterium aggregans]|uniref:tRNA (N(6)-L-threonylcarbamoyladenosine(37)-C(2))- methylthiotransferase MtaB n=2 Tax=Eubacterium aggregans TaxID=81409 RepID=UPI003F2A6B9F